MKKIGINTILFVAFIFIVSTGTFAGEKFGKPVSNRNLTPICNIFDHPKDYDGKTITMKGVVDEEDPNGTWFYMEDDECRVLVEGWRTNFRVGKLVGSTVLVEGKVYVDKKYNLAGFIPIGVEKLK